MLYEEIKYDVIRKRLRARIDVLELNASSIRTGVANMRTKDGLSYAAKDIGTAGNDTVVNITGDTGTADNVSVNGDTVTVSLRDPVLGKPAEATFQVSNNGDWDAGDTVTVTPNVAGATPQVFEAGVDFAIGASASDTMANLAAAITAKENVATSVIDFTGADTATLSPMTLPWKPQPGADHINHQVDWITSGSTDLEGNTNVTSDATTFSAGNYAPLMLGESESDTASAFATLASSITGLSAVADTAKVTITAAAGKTYPDTSFGKIINTTSGAQHPLLKPDESSPGTNHFSAEASGDTIVIKANQGLTGYPAGASGNSATVASTTTNSVANQFSAGSDPATTTKIADLINRHPDASKKITATAGDTVAGKLTHIVTPQLYPYTAGATKMHVMQAVGNDTTSGFDIGDVFTIGNAPDATRYTVSDVVPVYGRTNPLYQSSGSGYWTTWGDGIGQGHGYVNNGGPDTQVVTFHQTNDPSSGLDQTLTGLAGEIFHKQFAVDAASLSSSSFSGGSNVATYTVSVPTIVSDGGTHTASDSVFEDTTAITTVVATGGGSIVYAINQALSDDYALFSIDASTGILAFASAPDFENPLDIGNNNVYNFQVTATNSKGSDYQDWTITVTDADDLPTVANPISDLTLPKDSPNTVIDLTNVFDDVDNDNASITKVAVSGNTSLVTATIDSSTYANDNTLTLDYQAGQSGTTSITVTATSNGKTVQDVFDVEVTAFVQPVITSDPTGAISVVEEVQAVTTVVATGGGITYSLLQSGDYLAFTLNPTSGDLTFTTPPDYENPIDADTDNIYNITVSAGNTVGDDTQQLTITVTDVAEYPVVANPISDMYMDNGGNAIVLDVTNVFSDEDSDDALITVAASSTHTARVTAAAATVVGHYDNVAEEGFAMAEGWVSGLVAPIGAASTSTYPEAIQGAFDGTQGTFWDTVWIAGYQGSAGHYSPAQSGWIGQDFGAGNEQIITQYKVVAPWQGTSIRYYHNTNSIVGYITDSDSQTQGNFPRDWNFQASHDNVNWVTLDAQTQQQGNLGGYGGHSGEPQVAASVNPYDIVNTTAYRYYRLDVTEIHSGTWCLVGNLEMSVWIPTLSTVTLTSPGVPGTSTITVTGTSDGLDVTDDFVVEATNDAAPTVGNSLADVIAYQNDGDIAIDLTNVFTDADTDDTLITKSAVSSDTSLVTVTVDSSVYANDNTLNLSYQAGQKGTAEITVTGTSPVPNSTLGGRTVDDVFTVEVEGPTEITSNGGGPTAAIDVDENETAVTTVVASGKLSAGAMAYSISGGVDQALFSINSGTGELTFTSAPDYEYDQSDGGSNAYVVEVTATDLVPTTDTQTITATVLPVQEAPVVLLDGVPHDGSEIEIDYYEGDAPYGAADILTVTATELYADCNVVCPFQRVGGSTGSADFSKFAVDTTTGVLSWVTEPNYESDQSMTQDQTYYVGVLLTGPGGATTQHYKIKVKDVIYGEYPGNSIIPVTHLIDEKFDNGLTMGYGLAAGNHTSQTWAYGAGSRTVNANHNWFVNGVPDNKLYPSSPIESTVSAYISTQMDGVASRPPALVADTRYLVRVQYMGDAFPNTNSYYSDFKMFGPDAIADVANGVKIVFDQNVGWDRTDYLSEGRGDIESMSSYISSNVFCGFTTLTQVPVEFKLIVEQDLDTELFRVELAALT